MPKGIRTGTMTDAQTLDRYMSGVGVDTMAVEEGVTVAAIRARMAKERSRRIAENKTFFPEPRRSALDRFGDAIEALNARLAAL